MNNASFNELIDFIRFETKDITLKTSIGGIKRKCKINPVDAIERICRFNWNDNYEFSIENNSIIAIDKNDKDAIYEFIKHA